MYLRSGMKIKLKNEFLNSFEPHKNVEGKMDYLQGKIVTIDYIESDSIIEDDDEEYVEFCIKEAPRWYFGIDYIDYIVNNDIQMEIE